MTSRWAFRRGGRWLATGAGLAAGVYAVCAAGAWMRYGLVAGPGGDEADPLLDRFMPSYEIVERHHIRVAAPAATTFAAACEMDLMRGAIVNAIFRGRELALGATPDTEERPRQLLPLVQSLGWVVLAEAPGHEIVMGAVTKPWEANPTFRSIPPDQFAAFDEPGYVKIVWTLRADPAGPGDSIFRTETRAIATDAAARSRFRRYWALASPGIILIRWLMLEPLKREAEGRSYSGSTPRTDGQHPRTEG